MSNRLYESPSKEYLTVDEMLSKEYLSVGETALLLECSYPTVLRHIRRGILLEGPRPGPALLRRPRRILSASVRQLLESSGMIEKAAH